MEEDIDFADKDVNDLVDIEDRKNLSDYGTDEAVAIDFDFYYE